MKLHLTLTRQYAVPLLPHLPHMSMQICCHCIVRELLTKSTNSHIFVCWNAIFCVKSKVVPHTIVIDVFGWLVVLFF